MTPMLARSPSRPHGDDLVESLRRLVPQVPESQAHREAEIALSEARAVREDAAAKLAALRAEAEDDPRANLGDEIDAAAITLRRAEKRVIAARGPVDGHRRAVAAERQTVARRVLRPIAAEAAKDALPVLADLAAELERLHAAVRLLAQAGATGRGDTPLVNLSRPLAEIERGLRAWAETK